MTDCFRISEREVDDEKGTFRFRYVGPDGEQFWEEYSFGKLPKLSDAQRQALHRAVDFLQVAAGVSYYKLYYGAEIRIETVELSERSAEFFTIFYRDGLSEFIFRNNLDPRKAPRFQSQISVSNPCRLVQSEEKVLVPVGGGKDSIVTLQALKRNFQVQGFSVGKHRAIDDVCAVAGVDITHVGRKLSSNLFELNSTGRLNGHVPVTGIISCVTVIQAILGRYSAIAMSNERSANVGNNIDGDEFSINHQWSKSFFFEQGFSGLIASEISPDIEYFSALRPYSEFAIVRAFSRIPEFFEVFTSCNRAFKLRDRPTERWCGKCEKCRFVYICLACFVSDAELTRIFGFDVLQDISAISDYQAMIGVPGTRKPFECVGEAEEVLYATSLLSTSSTSANKNVIRALAADIDSLRFKLTGTLVDQIYSESPSHGIPNRFLSSIRGVMYD